MLKFVKQMQAKVQAAMPEKEVKIVTVPKNNGVKLTALQLCSSKNADSTCSISPSIYMEEYYAQYDGHNMDELFSSVMTVIDKAMRDMPTTVDKISDFATMQNKIFFTVVNASKNADLLNTVPHILWNDLAIVFRCMVYKQERNLQSFVIHNELAKSWKMSASKLMSVARENTSKLFPWKVTSMANLFGGVLSGAETTKYHNLDDVDENDAVPMYVATTGDGVNGAHVLLYPDVLAAFGEKCKKNFYIFPSSIHELIFVPEEKNSDVEQYHNIVSEVNSTQVLPDEFLSDNVYYYDRASCEVKIA